MKAWHLNGISDLRLTDKPLQQTEVTTPEPGFREILLRISCCGICHTELDEIEGRSSPPVYPVIPGHQVVGLVHQCGRDAKRFKDGDTYLIPSSFSDIEAAPLLCAGAIGYRSLQLSNVSNGQTLGLTGFGSSGHLVLKMTAYFFPHSKIFVFARNTEERAFALQLGPRGPEISRNHPLKRSTLLSIQLLHGCPWLHHFFTLNRAAD